MCNRWFICNISWKGHLVNPNADESVGANHLCPSTSATRRHATHFGWVRRERWALAAEKPTANLNPAARGSRSVGVALLKN